MEKAKTCVILICILLANRCWGQEKGKKPNCIGAYSGFKIIEATILRGLSPDNTIYIPVTINYNGKKELWIASLDMLYDLLTRVDSSYKNYNSDKYISRVKKILEKNEQIDVSENTFYGFTNILSIDSIFYKRICSKNVKEVVNSYFEENIIIEKDYKKQNAIIYYLWKHKMLLDHGDFVYGPILQCPSPGYDEALMDRINHPEKYLNQDKM